MSTKPSLGTIARELQLMISDALLHICGSTFSLVLVNRHFYNLLNLQLYRYSIEHDNGKCLAYAAANGHLQTAAKALEAGAKNETCRYFPNKNSSPLHLACTRGHLEVAKLLLQNGANVNDFGVDKAHPAYTPLLGAVLVRDEHTARLLIEHGARISEQSRGSRFRGHSFHILHIAVMVKCKNIVRLLIQRGVDIDVRDSGGRTPLNWVLRTGQLPYIAHSKRSKERLVKFLLEYHADPNARDFSGSTPKEIARRTGQVDLLYWLSIPPEFVQKPKSSWQKS